MYLFWRAKSVQTYRLKKYYEISNSCVRPSELLPGIGKTVQPFWVTEFHFIGKVLHTWRDGEERGEPGGETPLWEYRGFLGGLSQEAIFFQLPQTPLEKWVDLVLSLFKGMYWGQGGGAEGSCPCVQLFLVSPDAFAIALKCSDRLSEKYLHRQHCLVSLVILTIQLLFDVWKISCVTYTIV